MIAQEREKLKKDEFSTNIPNQGNSFSPNSCSSVSAVSASKALWWHPFDDTRSVAPVRCHPLQFLCAFACVTPRLIEPPGRHAFLFRPTLTKPRSASIARIVPHCTNQRRETSQSACVAARHRGRPRGRRRVTPGPLRTKQLGKRGSFSSMP